MLLIRSEKNVRLSWESKKSLIKKEKTIAPHVSNGPPLTTVEVTQLKSQALVDQRRPHSGRKQRLRNFFIAFNENYRSVKTSVLSSFFTVQTRDIYIGLHHSYYLQYIYNLIYFKQSDFKDPGSSSGGDACFSH